MKLNDDNRAVAKLCEIATMIGEDVFEVCKPILHAHKGDQRFWFCSGSSKPHQHHYGRGGLAEHTLEVVQLCLKMKLHFNTRYEIDGKELFLSAFFHDLGKMYDYDHVIDNCSEDLSLPHKRLIHHISRSGIIWAEHSKIVKEIHDQYFENVLHAILSHHISRSAGSPVAPKSRVAWLLTLCDNISARMYDADTLDIVKHYGG